MMKSWKTSLAAALTLACAAIAPIATMTGAPQWLVMLGASLASVTAAAGLLAARDNDRTSEQVGAGNVPPIPMQVVPSPVGPVVIDVKKDGSK